MQFCFQYSSILDEKSSYWKIEWENNPMMEDRRRCVILIFNQREGITLAQKENLQLDKRTMFQSVIKMMWVKLPVTIFPALKHKVPSFTNFSRRLGRIN
ncbi:hypothetical protein WN51_09861 [Melipona quadrifasciata]|uniref:Uncharacterized protein n=1 Tax=Melipona quadrifasciata TaxID=166423 RepID=A0A0M9A5B2_9HYME|nr:hypothetical protein WN51_09861 [Melipona quadrifasciata]